ncbi:MAG TPA: hypothetical protein VK789_09700 [Bryobacteraceae bacterium]|jgi:hypothetical protein|nr:hypothetical protein [Bryobacteraceae bacterium]
MPEATMTAPPGVKITRNRAAAWAVGITVSAVVGILCLVARELVLQRWFPFANLIMQSDARYLFKYIPDNRQLQPVSRGKHRTTVVVEINREGRRGATITSARPRIIVYGDSFITEATAISQNFVSDLARASNFCAWGTLQICASPHP